jgi:hypothetical protein
MMRRLYLKIFGFLTMGHGWCAGGCCDPDCNDCSTEWRR